MTNTKKKKVLVLINDSFLELKKSLISRFEKSKDQLDVIHLDNISTDLVENVKNYIKEFKSNNCEFGFVLWITGIAFTNLLAKALKNNVTFNTSCQYYYEDYQNNIGPIEILVLGSSTLGDKNIKLLTELHIKSIIDNKK
ncbi:hypothetical protein SCLARK_001279 [Spiroplasma clarkii]|uniref:Uncharacterized protein n=1 Tax=Spiroplasma clarkii TaxID=2139 RepID=A0A1Y0L293_9MOLU|nr:hypothetical protein [Spiroplasma clarkii]ARU91819.1 hypothetical protein SCLARK_001279 [Spiroplasma clarkii]ATX71183.1 hypothetical protein SCLAR_v1c08750 [Spiroplasma clarkii]